MENLLILKFIFASIIGMAAKLKQKNDSLKDLAVKGNFQFPTTWGFIVENKKAVIWTAVAMALWQIVMGHTVQSVIANSPNAPEPFLWGWIVVARRDLITGGALLLYTTIAYMGQDFLFGALSRTSKEVRAGLDWKTTIADKASGTLDAPTPIKLPPAPNPEN